MLTTYFKSRIGLVSKIVGAKKVAIALPTQAMRRPWLASCSFGTNQTNTSQDSYAFSAQIQKMEKVQLADKSFYWNSSLYEKLDQQLLMSKKDDEPPKGFEKFFKTKEKRAKEQQEPKQTESETEGKEESKKEEEQESAKCKCGLFSNIFHCRRRVKGRH